ncbi:hypothetical protein LR48_Vigan02g164800 [Vigna angularis]|uniref:Pectinesterase n=2 Tax=Phaseolus angularis TaxID=3914 RepID=A0A0L9TY48_PHAAN|nr:putative pectinesterase/pectinesterase inhibitor 28 [Vigna angularis]KOM35498.1 hypothetical protein LR48_Vigan02g164800 [Vigna angularis]
MSEEDGPRKRNIAFITVCTIFLVGCVIGIAFSVNVETESSNNAGRQKDRVISSVKAVKILCKPTMYQKECEKSLMKDAGNITDSRELIKIAFNVTLKKIGKELKKIDNMHKNESDPRAKMALATCKQLLGLSTGEFKRSIEKMGKFDLDNLNNILTSLKVWLSGAITYQETCLDGFKNTTTHARIKMRNLLTTSMHLSSNALAIISALVSTVELGTEIGSRQLAEGGEHVFGHGEVIPSWVVDDDSGAGVRRLLHQSSHRLKANAIVAKDGSEKFKSIGEALKMVPKKNKKPFVIYIREGVYREYVEVAKTMTRVVFVGDGPNRTRITGKRNFVDGMITYKTASVAIHGDYFVALNIGFENSAGPQKHEAVALRVQADRSIFYRCSIDGYEGTLHVHAMRQFYRECTVSGTLDFVFGDAVAVFQKCTFVVRKPLKNQQLIVTSQGRKEKQQPSGIVIQGSSIVAKRKVKSDRKAYLGRPLKNYSRTIFMNTYMEDIIKPEGYMAKQGRRGPSGMNTCFYGEYNNSGPGSNKSKRVKWRGIKKLNSKSARQFTPLKFFHGDQWVRITRIPYYPDILPKR